MKLIEKASIFSFFLFFLFPSFSFASTLFTNTPVSPMATTSLSVYQRFPIATNPTCSSLPNWGINTISHYGYHVSGDNNYYWSVSVWDGSAYTVVATSTNFSLVTSPGYNYKNVGIWDLQSICTEHYSSGGSPLFIFGLDLRAVSTGLAVGFAGSNVLNNSYTGNSAGSFDGSSDMAAILTGLTFDPAEQPYINITTPVNEGSYSNNVTFTIEYSPGSPVLNPSYDNVYLDLIKISPHEIYDVVPFEIEDQVPGSFTFSRLLDDNETYRVRAYMQDDDYLNVNLYSPWVTFYTGTATTGTDYIIPPPTSATSTPQDVSNLSAFFSQIPILSYINSFINLFDNFRSSTTTSTTTLSLPYHSSLNPNASTSEIAINLQDSADLSPVVFIREFISATLYFMAGLMFIFFIINLIANR